MARTLESFSWMTLGTIALLILFSTFAGCTDSQAGETPGKDMQGPVQAPTAIETGTVQPSPYPAGNSLQNASTTTVTSPVNFTVHSAFKTMEIQDAVPVSGNIFIVVNATIENRDETKPFVANETTVDITGGGPITQKAYGRLSHPFYWGPIPPKSSRTGEIVFGVIATTQEFTLTLADEQGNTILRKPMESIPQGTYQSTISDSTATQETPQGLNVTIHAAQKTTEIQDAHPLPGNIFVVINMTIENLADTEPLAANENTIDITGGGPMTQKIYDKVANPFYWGSIPPKSSRTGEIVFGVQESTNDFTLLLLDGKGKILLEKPIGTIPTGPYLPSLGDSEVLGETNFSSVIESLDTPKKAAEYADAKFTFVYHDGCISYAPEEFFRIGQGDCKDYATFLSYVLASHGYDTQIVAFKYFKDGKRNGHVVTLYKDTDGSLYYMTTPVVSNQRWVTSLDDLLKKECSRLGIPAIANYTVIPAGSLNTCVV